MGGCRGGAPCPLPGSTVEALAGVRHGPRLTAPPSSSLDASGAQTRIGGGGGVRVQLHEQPGPTQAKGPWKTAGGGGVWRPRVAGGWRWPATWWALGRVGEEAASAEPPLELLPEQLPLPLGALHEATVLQGAARQVGQHFHHGAVGHVLVHGEARLACTQGPGGRESPAPPGGPPPAPPNPGRPGLPRGKLIWSHMPSSCPKYTWRSAGCRPSSSILSAVRAPGQRGAPALAPSPPCYCHTAPRPAATHCSLCAPWGRTRVWALQPGCF